MNLNSYVAALFNDLQIIGLNRNIPLLSRQIFQSNAVLFYRCQIQKPEPETVSIKQHSTPRKLPSIDPSQLILAGQDPASESFLRLYKIHSSHAVDILNTGEPVFIPDMFDANTPATEHDRNITLEFNYRSYIAVPIIGKTSILGLVILFYIPVQTFVPEFVGELTSWSRFCGIALESSLLVQAPPLSAKPVSPAESVSGKDEIIVENGQLGLLAASISHEINNSLDGIKNYLYLISSETANDHPHKEYLKIVESEIERAGKIVQQLSSLNQPEKQIKHSVQINDIITSVAKLFDHYTKTKNYKIKLTLDKQLPEIQGVSEQLKSVFHNLFLNSIQAMPKGGEISVNTGITGGIEKKIKITISDTGEGIPREHIAHIFQPFYTTKKEGTGLGLTICRQIVKSHGGIITVDSLPEKGSQFIITFPFGE